MSTTSVSLLYRSVVSYTPLIDRIIITFSRPFLSHFPPYVYDGHKMSNFNEYSVQELEKNLKKVE